MNGEKENSYHLSGMGIIQNQHIKEMPVQKGLKKSGLSAETIRHIYRNFIAKSRLCGDPLACHIHTGLEIGTFLSGKGYLIYDNQQFEMSAGDSYFIDPLLPHTIEFVEEIENLYVQFPSEAITSIPGVHDPSRLLNPFLSTRSGTIPVLKANRKVHTLLQKAHSLRDRVADYGDIFTWSLILKALCYIHASVPCETIFPAVDNRKSNVMSKALFYLNNHATESISTVDIASHCCLSVSRFSHLFQEIMHITPLQYRDQIRVAKAIKLITETTDKITDIATECGFSNSAQFYRIVKNITGKSPARWRNSDTRS